MPELSTVGFATTFYNFFHRYVLVWRSKMRRTSSNKTKTEFTSGHKIRNSFDNIISPERAVLCNCNLQNAGAENEIGLRYYGESVVLMSKMAQKRTDDL